MARVFLTNHGALLSTPNFKPLHIICNEYKVSSTRQVSDDFSWQIKLLELRRDVGLRFLERAFQESHITINNLLQAVNARLVTWLFDGESEGECAAVKSVFS